MNHMDSIRDALKERVCAICIDLKDDGSCGLPDHRVCPLVSHLPEIVMAVEAVESFDLSDYVAKIRTDVCPSCSQDEQGHCRFRDSFDCEVDNLLYRVVDSIENVESIRSGLAV